MICTKTSTFFTVTCDRCHHAAPGSPIKEEAISQAIEADYQHVTWWNGLEYIHRHFCPDCFPLWEAEQYEKAKSKAAP